MADLIASANANRAGSCESDKEEAFAAAALNITQNELIMLEEEAISYAICHGMMIGMESARPGNSTLTHVPFCLLPVPFDKKAFQFGMLLSPLYGKLVDRVSRDLVWLHKTLDNVIKRDTFTAKLVQISKTVSEEGLAQKACLGIHRSDYMLDHSNRCEPPRLLQVELNTISCSFAHLSVKICDLHRFLLERHACDIPEIAKHLTRQRELDHALPENHAILMISDAIAAAHQHYGVTCAVVLFVVQANEVNTTDQRGLEYQLWSRQRIKVIRKTLRQVAEQAVLVQESNRENVLKIGALEISVTYYRSGYAPTDYPTDVEWNGRTLLERSLSIKCPSIAYHLAGTKKVQQELAKENVLEQFMTDECEAKQLRASFATLYGLDGDNSSDLQRIKQMVAQHPLDYVLKPQREGGGNNIYGQDVVNAMEALNLSDHILMARIHPQETSAVLVRHGRVTSGKTISELGMFITSFFDASGDPIVNCHAGHLLRTKSSSTDEGGVATGFSVLSSPYLL